MAEVQTAQKSQASAVYLDGYRRMLLIRLFETEMHKLFLAGEIHGTTHLGAGQEAVAVGTCLALEPNDYAAGTYRVVVWTPDARRLPQLAPSLPIPFPVQRRPVPHAATKRR